MFGHDITPYFIGGGFMEDKIKVIKVENTDDSIRVYVDHIANTLESMQKFLGGYIEEIYFLRRKINENISFIVNEEGRILDLDPSLQIIHDNKLLEVIHGNMIIVGVGTDGEDYISLNEHQIDIISKKLKNTNIPSFVV